MSDAMSRMTAAAPCIAYEDVGQGEPALLFLPGWVSDLTQVDPTAGSQPSTGACSTDLGTGGRRNRPPISGMTRWSRALAVIEVSGAQQVVPVAQAHAGWVAIQLRRQLGERTSKLALTSLLMLEPPAVPHRDGGGAGPSTMAGGVRPRLRHLARGRDPPRPDPVYARGNELLRLRDVGAGREITAAYARYDTPLKALATLDPPVPTLHFYGQPPDPGYLDAQEAFAAQHPWFRVRRLEVCSPFPTIEARQGG